MGRVVMWTRGRLTELHQARENVISLDAVRAEKHRLELMQEREARNRLHPVRRDRVSPAVPRDPRPPQDAA